MKAWLAILLSIGIVIVTVMFSRVVGVNLMLFVVPITALWAAIDSKKISLKKYKSGISAGPIALFFGVILLWIVVFPWYLVIRDHIKMGNAVLKDASNQVSV